MKQYYLERFNWIFKYTSNNFFYCLLKTLCIIIGAPIYAVTFIGEMIFTFVYCLFSWIPVLNIVVMVICKAIIFFLDKPFYICILPDIKKYLASVTNEPIYEVVEEEDFQAETPVQDEDQ